MKSEFVISVKAKNLFLSLAESIAQPECHFVLCLWGDQHKRPLALESKGAEPMIAFNETAFPKHRKGIWLLKTSIIRNYCISCLEGQFSTSMSDLTCLRQKFYQDTAQETQWWGAPNHTELQLHPLANFSNLQKVWDDLTANID
jgi:hypothetical protein